MLRTAIVLSALSALLILTTSCGGTDDPAHAAFTASLEVSPSPATAGAPVAFEVEVLDGDIEMTPNEVHIKVTKVGATTPVDLQTEPDGHHFKAMHTFDDAATYTIEVEAHVDGGDGHEEEVTTSAQLIVQ